MPPKKSVKVAGKSVEEPRDTDHSDDEITVPMDKTTKPSKAKTTKAKATKPKAATKTEKKTAKKATEEKDADEKDSTKHKRGLWLQDEIDQARQYFTDGLPLKSIAMQLNRTEASVKQKMFRVFADEVNGNLEEVCTKYHVSEEDLAQFMKKPNVVDVLVEIRELLKYLIVVAEKKV